MKRLVPFLIVAISSTVLANDFRVPLLGQVHGYDFDPRVSDGWSVRIDSNMYSRQADRAFGKHGTSTNDLTALFFGKDSFRLSNAFENCTVPRNTELYNPYMRIITIAPRARYQEQGVQLSLQIDRDAANGKGRWGARVRVPFKSVEIERRDTSARRDSQTEDVVRRQLSSRASGLGFAYRLDFLEAMPNNDMTTQQVAYDSADDDDQYIEIFAGDTRDSQAAAVYVPEGHTPRSTRVGISSSSVSSTQLPVTLEGLDVDTIYSFGNGQYASLSDSASQSAADRAADQDKKATVWVTSTHDNDGDFLTGATQSISSNMEDLLETFNTSVNEWLADRGYVMDTSNQIGLGDTQIELFYQHALSDRVQGTVLATAQLPTAYGSQYNDNLYAGNPYRAHLGNGGHFEVGVGGKLDWESYAWLNIHIDGTYQFALDSTEQRCAVPQGTFVKNMGPQQAATVSWSSFVGNVNFDLCHPHTTDITGMIGYQLYYKAQESVAFKSATADSWLGRLYNSQTADFTDANTVTLDNKLAAAGSEQWAHRMCMGLSYHFSDWFTMSARTAFTFAGRSAPKTLECQISCMVSL